MSTSPTAPTKVSRRAWLAVVAGVIATAAGGGIYALRSPALPVQPARRPADDAVQAALALGKPVVAEFGSVSCVSCREVKPILAELQRTHGAKLTVVDVDVLKERQYLSRYRIQLMPTQVFFDAQGREIGRHMGKITGEEILAHLALGGAAR
jgi:thioredoxin 1